MVVECIYCHATCEWDQLDVLQSHILQFCKEIPLERRREFSLFLDNNRQKYSSKAFDEFLKETGFGNDVVAQCGDDLDDAVDDADLYFLDPTSNP